MNEINNKTNEWDIDNLPNRITIFRIFLIPIVIGTLTINLPIWSFTSYDLRLICGRIACLTFIIASITDFFDGHFARKRNLITVFGSFLDPLADKFLVVSSLIMLLALNRIEVILVIILVLREMYITSLRLLASQKGINLPVDNWGKYKTATQMIGIPILMIAETPFGIPLLIIGKIFIYIASFLSIYSALRYSAKLFKNFKAIKKTKRST